MNAVAIEPLRDLPEEFKRIARGAYVRRGCPATSTGWNIKRILSYQKWQTKYMTELNIPSGEMGGRAWVLPRKSPEGEPSELPDYVLADVLPPETWAGWKSLPLLPKGAEKPVKMELGDQRDHDREREERRRPRSAGNGGRKQHHYFAPVLGEHPRTIK